MSAYKGIILAGGSGTRLYPLTNLINKQLLPVFNKPAIYYPLTTLMLAGIKEILIICNPADLITLQRFLGDGSKWQIHIEYMVQTAPTGIAHAFILGEKFIDNSPVCLILGDNIFHGQGFSELLHRVTQITTGAQIFCYPVSEPQNYGVAEINKNGNVISLEEKPHTPRSNYAITGLYFYDHNVVQFAHKLKPSARNELEITDLNKLYLQQDNIVANLLGRGFVWFDIGTPATLTQASQYINLIEQHQGLIIASPEEVAWRMGYITTQEFSQLIAAMPTCQYAESLYELITDENIANLKPYKHHASLN